MTSAEAPTIVENKSKIPERVLESIKSTEKREVVVRVVSDLLFEIESKYGVNGTDPLPFHNVEHTLQVIEDSVNIYKSIVEIDGDVPDEVIEDYICALVIAGAGHDTVMKTKEIDVKDVGGVQIRQGSRVRLRGWSEDPYLDDGIYRGNEFSSNELAQASIKKHNYDTSVLDENISTKVKRIIRATYPVVDPKFQLPEAYKMIGVDGAEKDLTNYSYGDGVMRIHQKYNNMHSSISSLSIGLADISYIGRVPAEEAVKVADCEYKETAMQVIDELGKLGLEKIAPARKKEIVASLLGWMISQIEFGITQKYNFDMAVENNRMICLSPRGQEIKDRLHEMHPHFRDFVRLQVRRFEHFDTKRYEGTETEQLDQQIRDLCESMDIEVI